MTAEAPADRASRGTNVVLLTLAAGQFLMTLDSSVMNVAIAERISPAAQPSASPGRGERARLIRDG
jgi:hypothetical protein